MIAYSPSHRLLAAAVLTAGLFAGAHAARADIISALSGAPTAVAGGYAYTYNVQLAGGQLDPSSGYTDGAGLPVAPQFGTIYDFGSVSTNPDGSPMITTTGLASQFSWTFNLTDQPAQQTAPNDNPTLNNIRFIYQGSNGIVVAGDPSKFSSGTSVTTVDPGPSNLGTFTIVSPYSSSLDPDALQYDGQSYKGANDTRQANVGFLAGPDVPVPEPASMALLGMGLLGAGLVRRRG